MTCPSPAFVSSCAVHLCDCKCQQTRESASDSAGCEENGNSSLTLVRHVPFRDQKNGSWEEPCSKQQSAEYSDCKGLFHLLKQPEKDPDTTKLCEIVHEPMAHHHQTPCCHYSAHEDRRSIEHVQDCIARDLCIKVSVLWALR